MSQRSEKYARSLGRMLDNQSKRLLVVEDKVAKIETVQQQMPRQCPNDTHRLRRLEKKLEGLEYILMLFTTLAVASVLFGVSLAIWGMV